jgi:hypothetical protein
MPSLDDDFYDLPPLAPKWSGPLSTQGLGPIFTATYESECKSCDDLIVPGEDARADGRGGWIHADTMCEKVAEAVSSGSDDRAGGRLCPSCFTFHAGECL